MIKLKHLNLSKSNSYLLLKQKSSGNSGAFFLGEEQVYLINNMYFSSLIFKILIMKKITLLFAMLVGSFAMNAQADCANAQAVTVADDASTTVNATALNGTAPTTVCNPAYYDETAISVANWYSFTAGSNDVLVNVSADVDQAAPTNGYIPSFSVLEGTCGDLTCLDGSIITQNQQTGALIPAEVDFLAEAGTTYYIVFDDFYANQAPEGLGTTDAFDFTVTTDTNIPAAPGLATNPTPADGATDVTIGTDGNNGEASVDLSWDAPTTGGAATSYVLIMSPDQDFPEDNTISGSFENSQIQGLHIPGEDYFEATTTYYWQVIPTNAGGSADPESVETWSFTTGGLSNNDFETSNFTHFYSNGQLGLEASQNIDNVSIYNMLGQEMLSTELSNNKESINVASFNNGMYITKVTIGDKTETFKFIKK
ncbi:MAG: T9SS type A sorting domain-containing protein [Psychroflexus sp.]